MFKGYNLQGLGSFSKSAWMVKDIPEASEWRLAD